MTLVMQPGNAAEVTGGQAPGSHQPDSIVRMHGHSAGFSFRMPAGFTEGLIWSAGMELVESEASREQRAISIDMEGHLIRLPPNADTRPFLDGKAVYEVSPGNGDPAEGTWSLLAVWDSPRGPVALRAQQRSLSGRPDFRWAWEIFGTLEIR
ncbi:MAG: hypothetical protein OXQ29_23840 [Rhodospirillaceae bacterium]|nr:hypothetical protein [Rhodospirillaceae bacterium]